MLRNIAAVLTTFALFMPLARAQDDPAPPKKSAEKARRIGATEDRAKIVRQLQKDYEDARSQLENKNTGESTRAAQKKIIDGLDKLLDQSNQSDTPADPQNRTPSQALNPGGADPTQRRQESGPDRPKGTSLDDPKPVQNSEPAAADANAGRPGKSVAENHGEGWRIDLPRRRFPDMDAFARERFLPRYEELLRAYYRSIAESARRQEGD